MRLYLAVAVLMLAFVAYTEAEEEQTLSERLATFSQKAAEVGQNVLARGRESLEGLAQHEYVIKSKEYIHDTIERIMQRFRDASN